MTLIRPGLYEQLITKALKRELEPIPAERKYVAALDAAKSAQVLSRYVAEAAKKALADMAESSADIAQQLSLVNRLLALLSESSDGFVDSDAALLMALLEEKSPLLALGKSASDLVRPETSIAQSSLFTGSAHEPQMFSELKKEIASADRIDMLVSFIKWSGLRRIIDELRTFVE